MVALYIASFCVEGVRLYLGIVGNLMEKVRVIVHTVRIRRFRSCPVSQL
jgi:hypothetical protein